MDMTEDAGLPVRRVEGRSRLGEVSPRLRLRPLPLLLGEAACCGELVCRGILGDLERMSSFVLVALFSFTCYLWWLGLRVAEFEYNSNGRNIDQLWLLRQLIGHHER